MSEKNLPILMYASSEADARMFYATRFLAPDPFIYLQTADKNRIFVTDLELDRAKRQAKVSQVTAISPYEARVKERINKVPTEETIHEILKEAGIGAVCVPGNFSLSLADGLRAKGYRIEPDSLLYCLERSVKSLEEVEAIIATQRYTEQAVKEALEILANSEIRGNAIFYKNQRLTAEWLRKFMHLRLMENDCIGQHTIVACGVQGCDPHEEGHGPLLPHQSIVIDIFPRSSQSLYFADMSRTVVKGKASPALKNLYQTVLEGQQLGVSLIKEDVIGTSVHQAIHTLFEQRGYKTGIKDGRMQGFFHGTGHGVGLEIHEAPSVSMKESTLKAGNVVTVEPGLYYPEIGAVRIEDMILVTEKACKNLTDFPKFLEID